MNEKRPVLSHYRSHWRAIAFAGVISVAAAILESAGLIAAASSVESLDDTGAPIALDFGPISIESTAGRFLLAAALLIMIATLSRIAAAWVRARAEADWTLRRRRAVMQTYMSAPYGFVSRQKAATLHELTGSHARMAGAAVGHLSTTLNSLLSLFVFMASALVLDVAAASVFSILGALAILAFRPILRWTKRRSTLHADGSVDLGITVTETAGIMREIKTLGVEEPFLGRVNRGFRSLARIARSLSFVHGATPQIFVGIGMLVLLATFAAAAQLSNGTFATLGGTAVLLFRALTFGQQLSGVQQRVYRTMPYAEALEEFIESARRDQDLGADGSIGIDSVDSMEFDQVTYTYDPTESPAVSDATFSLDRPGLVAFVGPSGTGKTTMAHLALGLLAPTEGAIRINGIPMREIRRGDLAGLVAIVPQDPVILHASVLDNIRLYRKSVTEEQAIAAAKSVGIHETVMALESGYDTEIGESTRDLSGGQRQRIVIARALAGSPSLIILDEPTSALDADSEQWVMDTLSQVSHDALAIVIAHRQETISRCDRVLRFEGGRLVEVVSNT